MDLRIVKTKKVIREAFLQLRKTTPLEKIRVRDLCSLALINKSTFYNHYEDVFALSDELENEILARCIESFAYKDCLFSDPERFLRNVPHLLDDEQEALAILFAGRYDVLYAKLRRSLRDRYSRPDLPMQDDVQLTFIIGGVMYAMQALTGEKKYSEAEITDCTVRILKRLQGLPA